MSTQARFNGAANEDNTGRRIYKDFQAVAFAASIALAIKAKASETLVQVAQLTGISTLTANVGTASTPPYVGDKLEILFAADGTARVMTFGTGFLPSGTLSVTGNKKAFIKFIFDGAAWVETNRTVTA